MWVNAMRKAQQMMMMMIMGERRREKKFFEQCLLADRGSRLNMETKYTALLSSSFLDILFWVSHSFLFCVYSVLIIQWRVEKCKGKERELYNHKKINKIIRRNVGEDIA